jgi:hypothetical protein
MIKTVFDIFNDVLTKKSGGNLHLEPNFNSICSTYMLCRLLRMRDQLVPLAAVLNRHQRKWSSVEMYLWLYKNLPKTGNIFVNYIKAPKKEKVKEEKKTVKENGFLII